MNDVETVDKIKAILGDRALELTHPGPRRIFLKVDPKDLTAVMSALRKELEFTFVSTITGLDAGENFEILYHLANAATNLNVRTAVPKSHPHVDSICAVIPGAVLYERELQDMFGLVIDNIPDGRTLILPDDWPAGQYPLRKDWKHQRPEEKIPGGKA
jgi:Ni,Fe-hydrogenase III component G